MIPTRDSSVTTYDSSITQWFNIQSILTKTGSIHLPNKFLAISSQNSETLSRNKKLNLVIIVIHNQIFIDFQKIKKWYIFQFYKTVR